MCYVGISDYFFNFYILANFAIKNMNSDGMVWLPDSKKIEDKFIRFDRMMHERDGQTDRGTRTTA